MEEYYKKSERKIVHPKLLKEDNRVCNNIFMIATIIIITIISLMQGIYSINSEFFSKNPFMIWWMVILFTIIWIVSKVVNYYSYSEIKYVRWTKK